MSLERQPIVFSCAGEQLVGVIERPEGFRNVGVVIVTAGPQYRVGSHRQFVLVARALAANGISNLRFDYRGKGDSGTSQRTFENIREDLYAAVAAFQEETGVEKIVLLGLCDAASACLIHGSEHPAVISMILVNPWVRTEQGRADAFVRRYYGRRLLSKAFWAKLAAGRVSSVKALKELLDNLRKMRGRAAAAAEEKEQRNDRIIGDFQKRMCEGFSRFQGSTLFVLSENDLTATEFANYVKRDHKWKRLMQRDSVHSEVLKGADHTFSTREWRDTFIGNVIDWIARLDG